MKKVLNGKLYNTKKSTPIATWDNGADMSDSIYCEETLCKTSTGDFFIYCKNVKGHDLIAITAEDAFEWLRKHDLLDKAYKSLNISDSS
ncbi:MAG: hypothetical protein H5T43_02420 [Methanomethylovorans sp.]|nr:hypothetical protein [Methanomethylovorans sp.]